MWGNHQPSLAMSEAAEILERVHLFGSTSKVDEQNVTTLNGSLDARKEHDSALCRVRNQLVDRVLAIVKRNRKGAIAEGRRPIDQLFGGIWNDVDGISGGVGVKFDFEHTKATCPAEALREGGWTSKISSRCTNAADSEGAGPLKKSACGNRAAPAACRFSDHFSALWPVEISGRVLKMSPPSEPFVDDPLEILDSELDVGKQV
jgi:hypothetical protein